MPDPYPQVIYPLVTGQNNPLMDKYERRRLRVKELIKEAFDNTQSRFAEAIGRDANYVSRMLYEAGKAGRKRIAEDMKDHIERSCRLTPGWLDMEPGTPVIPDGALLPYGWPFESVTHQQWERLSKQERELIENVTLALLARAPASASDEEAVPLTHTG